jgi:hypothetical protein
MKYRCPVCMFASLPYPPTNYHICPCCSTEFGNDNADFSSHQLREMWIAGGAHWFFGEPPRHWNPWVQLIEAGFGEYVPQISYDLCFQLNASSGPAEIRKFTNDSLTVSFAA